MRFRAKTARAFTLIELLVVMAIIAVLVGLLFPSFRAARESANIAVCTSNLQQIWRALNAYTTDNQGRLPWNETGGPAGSWIAGYTATGTNGILGLTRGTLYKYVKTSVSIVARPILMLNTCALIRWPTT